MSAFRLLALFALLQNLDNAVVAAAYRLRNVVIPFSANLLIAALSAAATGFAVIAAEVAKTEAVNVGMNSVSDVVGRGILLMIGIWTLAGYFRKKIFPHLANLPDCKTLVNADNDASFETIKMRTSEAIMPATALAIDNLGPSFAFGLMDPNRGSVIVTGFVLAALTAAFSIAAVWTGQAAGRKGIDYLRWISPAMASGCLMIVIALLDPGDFTQAWLKP